jgi:GNAT superfamily N-acetyltransferase
MASPRIEVRPRKSEDEERLSLEIHNAVWPWRAVTMDEVRSFQSAVNDYGDFLADVDGVPAGSAAVAIEPQRPQAGFVLLTVLEESRRRGAGSALYAAVSDWLRARGVDVVHAFAAEADADSLAYAARRGFVEIERYPRMLLELASIDEPRVEPPEGVQIVTWAERPELARGIYDVAVEAYADVPGGESEEMESFEDWLAHDMQGSGDRPEATFVALAGSEVVGYAKYSLTAARPTVAFHDMTGVRRDWRGRGVAKALKHAQIAWAKRSGFEQLDTSNEERNEPIRRLNAQLGYRQAPGRVLLEGPLAPRPATSS